ncbi:MAG: hypothetical protein HY289_02185 [Planctomycetes bacterium]|nr:hypothetical protein [Planctomycetota bacterium]
MKKLILVIVLLIPGCGPGKGDVTGVVYHQKKPLPGGTITFYDEHKGVASGKIEPDGKYTVTGVTTGSARIAVVVPMAIAAPGVAAPKVAPIDPKYADPAKSGLTCKVGAGSQVHQVDLD